jgi:hypothetical protein
MPCKTFSISILRGYPPTVFVQDQCYPAPGYRSFKINKGEKRKRIADLVRAAAPINTISTKRKILFYKTGLITYPIRLTWKSSMKRQYFNELPGLFFVRKTQNPGEKLSIAGSTAAAGAGMSDVLIYYVKANRFLRGMVRGLAGTMLQVGRGKISLAQFEEIIQAKDSSKANFAVPGKGLFLVEVQYPDSLFTDSECVIQTNQLRFAQVTSGLLCRAVLFPSKYSSNAPRL